jgi:23S rRNA pseudouridine1911/1915/1917 synthase
MVTDTFVASEGRLDSVIAAATGRTRADAQRAIVAGDVTVDGSRRARSARLAGGEHVVVHWRAATGPEPEPGPDIPIRFRDEHLLVVAKPAGLLSHPTPARPTGTLVNRLLAMGETLAPAGGPWRPGIVHRLDAGTSGLMIVARTDGAFAAMQAMFRRHAVERTYLALVAGEPEHDGFTVDAPLQRRSDRIVVDRVGGREASTEVEVLERLGAASLVRARPRTGRTHQIRVHLAAVGHPVVGDRPYGGRRELARMLGLDRPFLHSADVGFEHPMTGERVSRSEPLPADLAEALDRARRDLRP